MSAWLQKLFRDHTGIVQMKGDGRLQLSEAALHDLESQTELAEVDKLLEDGQQVRSHAARLIDDEGIAAASMQPTMTRHHVFSMVKNVGSLYLKMKDALRLKKDGRVQVLDDNTPRTPAFHVSPTMAFPHLYPEPGQQSPLDQPDATMAAHLLRKQLLYAHPKQDGTISWMNQADSIHMMHSFASLQERIVNAKVGFVMSDHPETAHIPIEELLNVLKQGVDDHGIIDSRLPNLSTVMSQISNSREFWYAQRQAIEAMSRDCGCPNLFSTYSVDCRNWLRTRQLLYKLESLSNSSFGQPDFDTWYPSTEEWTGLVDKHAALLSDYLWRLFESFYRAFYCDVCGIPANNTCRDFAAVKDRSSPELAWYWKRVEWTETRGLPHWHCIAKLPHVLDNALLGRVTQNGRLCRNELLCGNVKPEYVEEAWTMVEMGFLAERYALLYVHSIQRTSFYNIPMGMTEHDDRAVIHLAKLTSDFVDHYKAGEVTYETHPIMRTPLMPDCCCATREMEVASIAAVSQVSVGFDLLSKPTFVTVVRASARYLLILFRFTSACPTRAGVTPVRAKVVASTFRSACAQSLPWAWHKLTVNSWKRVSSRSEQILGLTTSTRS